MEYRQEDCGFPLDIVSPVILNVQYPSSLTWRFYKDCFIDLPLLALFYHLVLHFVPLPWEIILNDNKFSLFLIWKVAHTFWEGVFLWRPCVWLPTWMDLFDIQLDASFFKKRQFFTKCQIMNLNLKGVCQSSFNYQKRSSVKDRGQLQLMDRH